MDFWMPRPAARAMSLLTPPATLSNRLYGLLMNSVTPGKALADLAFQLGPLQVSNRPILLRTSSVSTA